MAPSERAAVPFFTSGIRPAGARWSQCARSTLFGLCIAVELAALVLSGCGQGAAGAQHGGPPGRLAPQVTVVTLQVAARDADT